MYRTRYTLAALMVASSFAGCKPGSIEPVDACPNLPGFQAEGPCEEPYSMTDPVIESPASGVTVTQGDMLSCRVRVSEKNPPAGSSLKETWYVNGVEVVCDSIPNTAGPQLASGVPLAPVTSSLPPGEYKVVVKTCNTSNGVCKESASVIITVVERVEPDLLVVTTFEGVYPTADCGEIWYGADTAGTSLKRVTNSCGDKRDAQLSPDGQTLIYISNRRLWRANADGTNPQIYSLIWEGNVLEVGVARISPDGKKIAVSVGISGWIGVHAFVVNVDGTGLDKVMSKEDSFASTVQWLPSGELVLGLNLWDEARTSVLGNEYLKYDPSTRSKVSLFTVGTGEWSTAQVLGVDPQGDWFGLWDYFGSRKIGFVATDGSGLFKTLDRAVWYPFVCSDGTEICYQPNSRELWSMDLDGQNVRKWLETVGRWIYSVTVWAR